MAATVTIVRLTGATPTEVDITTANLRLKQADNNTQDTNNPVPVPGSGTNLSTWAPTQLKVGATGATNGLNNLQVWANGTSMGTGVTLNDQDATTYVQAPTTNLTGGGSGELNTTNYSTLTGAPVNVISTWTSGAKKSVAGSITTGVNQRFGNLVAYQLSVGTTAGAGNTGQPTITWSYDET